MTIWNVIFVWDGVPHVSSFTDAEAAAKRELELLKEHGECIEDLYTEKDLQDEMFQRDISSWAEDKDARCIEGKHYYIHENDSIQIQTTEVEDTKCVWLPDPDVIKHKIGREPTEDELVDVRHAFEKGIEGQVDWQMAFEYAIESEVK